MIPSIRNRVSLEEEVDSLPAKIHIGQWLRQKHRLARDHAATDK